MPEPQPPLPDEASPAGPTSAPLLAATGSPEPRPDLAGARLKGPNESTIFLVDPDGFLRALVHGIYENLFRDRNGIHVTLDLPRISMGPPLWNAILITSDRRPGIYILDDKIKRWIVSPQAMDRYHFNYNAVIKAHDTIIEAIERGPDWS